MDKKWRVYAYDAFRNEWRNQTHHYQDGQELSMLSDMLKWQAMGQSVRFEYSSDNESQVES